MAFNAGDSVADLPNGMNWRRTCCPGSTPTTFRVRHGPDYARNGIKEPSAVELTSLVALDVFRTPRKVCHDRRQLFSSMYLTP